MVPLRHVLLGVLVVVGTVGPAAVVQGGRVPADAAGPAPAVAPGASAPVHVAASPTAPRPGTVTAHPVRWGLADGAATVDAHPRPDPEDDAIGWEGGYWHDEPITVDQSDGLNASEREAFLSRTMARVEYIRGLEFTERPELEFIDRGELRERRAGSFGLPTDDQLWEAMWLFGEDTNASRAIAERFGGSVLAYAAEEGSDHVVVVNADPSEPQISAGVLAHELVHVLQHQQFDLSAPRYRRTTLDGEFAKDGIVEGEASYVDQRYAERCGAEWRCVDAPPVGWAGASLEGSWRFHRLTVQPYSDGAHYVATLRDRGGWDAVDAAHADPPESSAAIVHPGLDAAPEPMTLPDRSTGRWTRVGPPQTVGEVGAYMTLWRQVTGEGQVDQDGPEVDGPYDRFDYNDSVTAGWANDKLVTYTDGERRGYVWALRWRTAEDAAAFAAAYRDQLATEGANRTAESTWVLEDGPFADAFRVVRSGRTVVVVNGPTEDALSAIRDPDRPASPTPTSPGGTASPTGSADPGTTAPATPTTTPGLGVAGALAGLVGAVLWRLARRRR